MGVGLRSLLGVGWALHDDAARFATSASASASAPSGRGQPPKGLTRLTGLT